MATRLQATGNHAGPASGVSKAFTSDVTAGSLIVVMGVGVIGASTPFQQSDCTKTSGTSTISTLTLHQEYVATVNGGYYGRVGIWTAVVTAGGSLTLNVATTTNYYALIGIAEFSPTDGYLWDDNRYEAQNESNGTNAAPTSGNVTSAGAAVFAGCEAHNSGTNSTIVEDANWSAVYESQDGTTTLEAASATRITSTGLTDDANWTVNAGNIGWVAGAACFKETSGDKFPYAHDGVKPWTSIWRPARI
jgi:hypothetical protein